MFLVCLYWYWTQSLLQILTTLKIMIEIAYIFYNAVTSFDLLGNRLKRTYIHMYNSVNNLKRDPLLEYRIQSLKTSDSV